MNEKRKTTRLHCDLAGLDCALARLNCALARLKCALARLNCALARTKLETKRILWPCVHLPAGALFLEKMPFVVCAFSRRDVFFRKRSLLKKCDIEIVSNR